MQSEGERVLSYLRTSIRTLLRDTAIGVLAVSMLAVGLVLRWPSPASAMPNPQCWFIADSGTPHTSNDLLTFYDGTTEVFIDGGASTTDGTGTTNIEAMAFQPGTNVIFATNNGLLGTVDSVTGEFAAVGPTGFADVDSLSFDKFNGKLYGVARLGGDDELFEINPNTGALVPGAIGGLDSVPVDSTATVGLSDIDDIALSPIDGQLYAAANNGGPDRVIRIDPTTGAVTDVGPTTPALDLEGLTFDSTGNLYGTTGSSAQLYHIDLATGAATLVANLNHADYEAAACMELGGFNTITGTVFLDKDSNATFGGTDTGTAGVTVTLYRDSDNDGTVSAGDVAVSTTSTAADGTYEFEMAAYGAFVIDIDTATLPASFTLTTDNLEAADFGATYGNTDPNNNFGFIIPSAFSVVKTSDAVDLVPGDTVTYTIEVTNTSTDLQTDVFVLDGLPTGTTYVANSTTATFPVGSTTTFSDNFESGNFSGGTGAWAGPWTELGESDGPGGGDIRIETDVTDLSVRLRDNDNGGEGIRRNVDLSAYTSATLSFDYRPDNQDDPVDDFITIDVSSNGGASWNNLATILNQPDNASYTPMTLTLPPGSLVANTAIRFLTGPNNGGSATVFIDNVVLEATSAGLGTRTNAIAEPDPLVDGDPPNLVVAGDQIDLAPGEVLTVTYQVDVVSPSTETEIVNIATAESVESPPASGSVTDPLLVAGVSDFVFDDLNANGIQDGGEPGLANVALALLDSAGTQILTTTTDANGLYQFTGLAPGDYRVELTLPAGFAFTNQDQGGDDTIDSDFNPATDQTALITLGAGEQNDTVDAGLFGEVTIGDRVWNDTNYNGVQDGAEAGIANVTVNLLDGAGGFLATTTTDASGLYSFTNLLPGTYIIEVVTPAGMLVTNQDAGADDTIDSDTAPGDGRTAAVTLNSGEVNNSLDAGFIAPAVISDFVWHDVNANGLQDGGEPGLAGVTVNLLDGSGTFINSAITDAIGLYAFSNLAPGDYIIEIVPPAGFDATTADVGGDDTIDSDISQVTNRTGIVTVTTNEVNTSVDAGLVQLISLGDFVWDDLNANGVQDSGEPGLAGVTVNLLDGTGGFVATTATDAAGAYLFANQLPGEYILEFVPPAGFIVTAQDTGADDDVDSDIASADRRTAPITLTSGETDLSIDAGFFGAAVIGNFVFEDLNANGIQDSGEPGIGGVTVNVLDGVGTLIASTTTDASGSYGFTKLLPGSYVIEVVAPAGFTFSPLDAGGDDTVDSDIIPATGRTAPVILGSSDVDLTRDAGLHRLVSIGNRVWDDTDKDGVQDGGEPGLAGVTVNLLDGSGTFVATTSTDAAGLYAFTNLVAGDYIVEFIKPAGRNISPIDVGADDTLDSDADLATGRTGVITLVSGTNDTTVDAGTYVPEFPAALGDFVWEDLDGDGIQDAGEPGIDAVVVNLLDSGGAFVASTTTDGSGAYSFPSVNPGDYIIEVIPPAGFVVTTANQGGDDGIDSDIAVASGRTAVFSLVSAGIDLTVDGGLYRPVTLGDFVWHDLNANGIQNVGEPGLAGVTVNLLDGAGNPVASTTTDGTGAYLFDSLVPGDYSIVVLLPAGYEPTGQDLGGNEATDSDVDPTGASAVLTLVSGAIYSDLDAGLIAGASIGDFVWHDLNATGIQDFGEPGLPGVTVNLLDGAGNPVATTTTDAAGAYSFTDLAPGDYIIEVVTPAGYTITKTDIGVNDSIDSDIAAGDGRTAIVNLISGFNNVRLDAGFFVAPAIGDFVFDDLNANGLQDVDEPGIEGVTVNLLDGAGNLVGTTATGGMGDYGFTNLTPGSFIIEVVVPAGYSIAPRNVGADDTIDSDIDTTTGRTAVIFLASTEVDFTQDGGLFQLGTVGDLVWDDLDGDGIQDAGEPGLAGVTVNLLDGAGNPVASTSTDGAGLYSFTGLQPGDYMIEVVAPPGFDVTAQDTGANDAIDSDIDAAGQSAVFTVDSGDSNQTLDAGFVAATSIGNFVWDDLNGNGIQDAGEPGLAGVTVNLLDGAGNPLATTTTDGTGGYSFTGLAPGNYIIQVVAPPTYAPTLEDAGADDTVDSDIDTAGESSPITLTSGEFDQTVDAGLVSAAAVGDFVWDDLNADGIQDAGEPGLAGVTVNLLDGAGNPVASTTTSAAGAYSFTGLAPADYIIEVVSPATYGPTTQDVGSDDTVDSDVNASGQTAVFTLISGQGDLDIDAGLVTGASIGDFVWDDLNADGIQDAGEPGLAGVTVNLLDGAGNPVATTTTSAAGAYSFTGLAPGDYIIQVVSPASYAPTTQNAGSDDTLDSDIDGAGETAAITLTSGENNLDVDGGLVAGASIGDFVWDDLNANGIQDAGEPGLNAVTVNLLDGAGNPVATTATSAAGAYSFTGLAPGDYIIEIATPAGYTVTPQNSGGDDTVDSDIAAADGQTAVLTVTSGENNLDIDGGFFAPPAIGNLIWDDLNADGIQDAGEPGLAGVTVNLFDSGGNLVQTTLSDASGNYGFTGLVPGSYIVEVVAPAGFVVASLNVGADDTIDSDINAAGQTAPIPVASGDIDLTQDAGLYQLASIGDFVWDDLNGDGIQDAGEPGLAGVTVNLLDGAGNPIAATTTDGVGAYSFIGLAPGDYIIEVVAPAGSAPSPQNVGADDTADSDVNPAGQTAVFTLISGESDPSLDAGLISGASIGDFVWDDLDADGIQDAGEPGLAGVTVNLLDGAGNPLATTTTDATGAYGFVGVAPGDYIIEIISPATYAPTAQDQGADDAVDSDVDPTGRTGSFTVASGDNLIEIDAGLVAPAAVGNFVWDDLNGDGIQDPGEPGLAGVQVNLLGSTPAATLTNGLGVYSFAGLAPGDYSIEIVAPAGYSPTTQDSGADDTVDSDINAAGQTVVFTLSSGDSNIDIDGGLVTPGSVGDFVWDDLNADGIQDAGEPGLAGVTVNLLDGAGNPVATTTTDGGGAYSFTGLAPGDYIIEVIEPVGYAPTARDSGADDTVDSDINAAGRTAVVAVASGETDLSLDAGLVSGASIGDFVFNDLNANGIQDAGEPGIDAVTVNLLDTVGNVLATTTTDPAGAYGFAGLAPGDYVVEVIAPAGYSPTTANVGADDTVDSDVAASGQVGVTLISGENNADIDAGLVAPAELSGLVLEDLDGDGVQEAGEPAIVGATVNLLDTVGNVLATTTTDGTGSYSFTGLQPGDYVVEVVPPATYVVSPQDVGSDDTIDSDIDASGQTAVVTLVSGESKTDVDAAMFRPVALGDFVFDDLNGDGIQDAGEPGLGAVTINLLDGAGNPVASTTTDAAGIYSFAGLNPGDYIVEVVSPASYTPTAQNTGADDAIDSDIDGSGRTAAITLSSGDDDTDVDAGLVAPATVGDFVWDDLNGDGIQDAGEPGLAGVTVNLLDTAGNPLASTVTDGAGAYSFSGLAPGDYIVEIVAPVSYGPTAQNSGADDTIDSDIDGSGRTVAITLQSGTNDTSQDGGLVASALVGDRVWDDLDGDGIQDAGEPGLAGVTVNLLDTAGNVVATTTTDPTGIYNFSSVAPGDYVIEVVVPATYTPTSQNSGADDTIDSDVDPSGQTATLTVSSGDANTSVDAGLLAPASISGVVRDDLNGDGLEDGGEPPLAGITVNLLDTVGNVIATTPTDGAGAYSFTGLAPGDYVVEVVVPAPYGTSPQDVGADDTIDSDIDAAGRTATITLVSGDDVADVDGLVVAPSTIGDFVWDDFNGDGLQDVGEPGLAGVTVNLTDTAGNVLASTVTDATGAYSFSGLVPGDYVVQVDETTVPADYFLTSASNPIFVTSTSGSVTDDADFGYMLAVDPVGDIEGNVFYDTDSSATFDVAEPPLGDITVNLLDTSGNIVDTTTTLPDGSYRFTGVPVGDYIIDVDEADPDMPGAPVLTTANDPQPISVTDGAIATATDVGYVSAPGSLAGTVVHDINRSDAVDAADGLLAGVAITATWAGPDAIFGTPDDEVTSTTTAADGTWLFTGLTKGDYEVAVDAATAPFGLDTVVFDNDSVADGSTLVTLGAGQAISGIDTGLVGRGGLGDLVYLDENGNNAFDPSENGAPGVGVIVVWAGQDGIARTADDVTYRATTDSAGSWGIADLPAGAYEISIDQTTLLEGVTGSPSASLNLPPFTVMAVELPLRVTAPTLPFTGSSTASLMLYGSLFVLIGAIALIGTRRRREEEEALATIEVND